MPSAAVPRKFIIMKGLFGGRTRVRTWDPLIKSQRSVGFRTN
jgi:hypothetical protein